MEAYVDRCHRAREAGNLDLADACAGLALDAGHLSAADMFVYWGTARHPVTRTEREAMNLVRSALFDQDLDRLRATLPASPRATGDSGAPVVTFARDLVRAAEHLEPDDRATLLDDALRTLNGYAISVQGPVPEHVDEYGPDYDGAVAFHDDPDGQGVALHTRVGGSSSELVGRVLGRRLEREMAGDERQAQLEQHAVACLRDLGRRRGELGPGLLDWLSLIHRQAAVLFLLGDIEQEIGPVGPLDPPMATLVAGTAGGRMVQAGLRCREITRSAGTRVFNEERYEGPAGEGRHGPWQPGAVRTPDADISHQLRWQDLASPYQDFGCVARALDERVGVVPSVQGVIL